MTRVRVGVRNLVSGFRFIAAQSVRWAYPSACQVSGLGEEVCLEGGLRLVVSQPDLMSAHVGRSCESRNPYKT